MAIEGPLRELGIHDVFQLLDLSRKTGRLRVTSELRDDEGLVHFASGKVIQASIRSLPTSVDQILCAAGRVSEADVAAARERAGPDASPAALADALVAAGAVSHRELERQVRQQIETVVFELMSWHEGFFSFEEMAAAALPGDSRISVSTESLLMEGARRIDEWSRIADHVPSLAMIPVFAPVADDRDAQLDLLPHEWEVLTMIDGARDLHGISSALGRSEFEIAKVAYGLITTGVVELNQPKRRSRESRVVESTDGAALDAARAAMGDGDYEGALQAARAAVDGAGTEARLLAARALERMARFAEAMDELRQAVHADPLTPAVHLDLGFAAVRMGEFGTARASWEHFLRLSPTGADAARAKSSLDALTRLMNLMEAHADG
jgi:tetratricopeptide (TPR) repeat protein